MGEKSPLPTALGMLTDPAFLQNNMEISQQMRNMTQQVHFLTLPQVPKTQLRKKHLFIAELLMTAKTPKQPQHPRREE